MFFFSFSIYQEGSIWLFTAENFDGSLPFTVQANYEGFSEGIAIIDYWRNDYNDTL